MVDEFAFPSLRRHRAIDCPPVYFLPGVRASWPRVFLLSSWARGHLGRSFLFCGLEARTPRGGNPPLQGGDGEGERADNAPASVTFRDSGWCFHRPGWPVDTRWWRLHTLTHHRAFRSSAGQVVTPRAREGAGGGKAGVISYSRRSSYESGRLPA